MPLDYWNKEKTTLRLNERIQDFLTEVFVQVRDNGINKTLTKKNIKEIYNRNCVETKKENIT